MIDAIAKDGGADILIAAVPTPVEGTGGWSNHLRGFALAEYGIRLSEWRDMSCADAKRALASDPDKLRRIEEMVKSLGLEG